MCGIPVHTRLLAVPMLYSELLLTDLLALWCVVKHTSENLREASIRGKSLALLSPYHRSLAESFVSEQIDELCSLGLIGCVLLASRVQ